MAGANDDYGDVLGPSFDQTSIFCAIDAPVFPGLRGELPGGAGARHLFCCRRGVRVSPATAAAVRRPEHSRQNRNSRRGGVAFPSGKLCTSVLCPRGVSLVWRGRIPHWYDFHCKIRCLTGGLPVQGVIWSTLYGCSRPLPIFPRSREISRIAAWGCPGTEAVSVSLDSALKRAQTEGPVPPQKLQAPAGGNTMDTRDTLGMIAAIGAVVFMAIVAKAEAPRLVENETGIQQAAKPQQHYQNSLQEMKQQIRTLKTQRVMDPG